MSCELNIRVTVSIFILHFLFDCSAPFKPTSETDVTAVPVKTFLPILYFI